MSERRSSRSKKAIKYTAFDNEHSDDDFADATPPPPKKQKATDKKKVGKEEKLGSGETVADVSLVESVKKRRAPISEKIYERELQQALEMSLIGSQESKDFKTHENPSERDRAKTATSDRGISEVLVDENIEVLKDDKQSLNGRPQRSIGSKETSDLKPISKSKVASDGEYSSDSESEEEDVDYDDVDDDGDSDFGSDHQSTKKKKAPLKVRPDTSKTDTKPKKNEAAQKSATRVAASLNLPCVSTKPVSCSNQVSTTITNVKKSAGKTAVTAPSRSSAVKSTVSPSLTSAVKSSVSPSLTSAVKSSVSPSLTSSWKPPASASSNSTSSLSVLKSPSSGLRLGLSRNQRVKPLHPSVHVT